MRVSLAALVSIVVWLGGSPASAQGIKDLAELVPAKTLAYVELRQPGAIAKEVARLLEGSYLADVPESLASLKIVRRRGPDPVSIAGLAITPEVIQEIGRIKGAAVVLTGIDKEARGMPEYVVIVQPGESNIPGFVMRLAITAAAHGYHSSDGKRTTSGQSAYERVEQVEGVGIYRMVRRETITEDGKATETKRFDRDAPALAQMPDALVIGSADLVKDVIQRAKGKGKGPSLASVDAFQKASRDFDAKPGLVAFANPPAVMDLLESIDLGREGRQVLLIVKNLVNPKAFVAVGDQLSLDNGTLRLTRRIYLNPEEKSPLLEVLPRTGAPWQLARFAPPDALAFAALANDNGERRFKQILELADGIVKALGPDADGLPSQHLGKLEGALGLDLGKDIAGKIRGVGVAVPGLKQFLKSDLGRGFGLLFIDAVDAEAAAFLAKDAVPKIVALLAQTPDLEPREEKVAGHLIITLPTKRRGIGDVHYGRLDKTLVLGPNRPEVVEALTNGQKKTGLLSDAKMAERIMGEKDGFAVAMVRPLTLGSLFAVNRVSARPDSEPPQEGKFERRGAGKEEPLPKAVQQIMELLKTEEPLLFSIGRSKDQIWAGTTYPGLRPLVARLVNFGLDEYTRERGPRESGPAPKVKGQ